MTAETPTLAAALDEHFWLPGRPASNEEPSDKHGCYCGWRCEVVLYTSPLAQYRRHLHEAITDALTARLADPAAVEAVALALKDHDTGRMECMDHAGACCPSGHHAMASSEIRPHDATAALEAVRALLVGGGEA